MTGYERARVWDLRLGDVVRRAGRPLRVGIVHGVDGEDVLVRWSPAAMPTRHHYSALERRLAGEVRAA